MKIKQTISCDSLKSQLLKQIMKTFIFLFCTTVFSFSVENSFSQEKIIIDQNQLVEIDEVFKTIQLQTDFDFIYPKGFFKSSVKVELKKGEISAGDLMNLCLEKWYFSQPICYLVNHGLKIEYFPMYFYVSLVSFC